MVIKIIILLLLFAIILSLFSGLVFLVRDGSRSNRTVNALALRITLSLILIAVVIYGFYSGQLDMHAPWLP